MEADLALARGRLIHARFLDARARTREAPDDVVAELALFERANELYRSLGDVRGEAEAQFWIGTFHQVVRQDDAAAVPALQRARIPGTRADDPLTLSYALRHLGIAEHHAGHLGQARSYLEESTGLRRQLRFGPGVAANLVGLAYIAADDGRSDEMPALLNEADSIASQSAAAGSSRQIDEARPHGEGADGVARLLSIGEFSAACQLSPKALRLYDRLGLLRPAEDAATGYRWYTPRQIARATGVDSPGSRSGFWDSVR